MKITFIGHASTLIEIDDQRILTDPNFSPKIFWLWKRWQPMPFPAESLAPVDLALISNAHYSHLDIFSFKYFKIELPLLTPIGVGKIARKFLNNPITEMYPNAINTLGKVKIHALSSSAYHYRFLPVRRQSLDYVIESSEGNIYFSGLSGYNNDFKEAGQRFPFKVALLPFSDSEKTQSKSCRGLNPSDFLQAMRDLNAEYAIPIRWGTFGFKQNNPTPALTMLQELAARENLDSRLRILKPGEIFEI